MTAAEAKEYGLVDEVLLINPRKEKERLDSECDIGISDCSKRHA